MSPTNPHQEDVPASITDAYEELLAGAGRAVGIRHDSRMTSDAGAGLLRLVLSTLTDEARRRQERLSSTERSPGHVSHAG
jgi:hypothetical protein